MQKAVRAGLGAGATMLALDAVWLSTMADPVYRANLPGVMLEGFRLGPAALFYLLYVAGIVYFAILPGLQRGSLARVALNGALLGLLCYGTYDLTNHATMKVWSTMVTVVDMAWGTVLTAIAATAGGWWARGR